MWQIYLPAPKKIIRPRFDVSAKDEVHQADLLFLPHDTVGKKTYRYALTLVDVGTRYKEAEPLTSKDSKEVARAFEKIYRRHLKVITGRPRERIYGCCVTTDGKT